MRRIATLALSMIALLAQPALADDSLVATLEVNRIIRAPNGAERREPAASAAPHDVLEYRTTYLNQSPKTLRDVAATLPIPTEFEYIEHSADTPVEASLDGRKFATPPLTRIVTTPDGRDEVHIVPAKEYRFLRWRLGDLPPSETSTVSARVRMANVQPDSSASR